MAAERFAPSTGSGQAVTMVFGGDTAIRGPSVKLLEADPASVFGPITEQLTGADLALLNLETAITTRPATPEDKEFTFATGPEVFDALRAAGVDGVSTANSPWWASGGTRRPPAPRTSSR